VSCLLDHDANGDARVIGGRVADEPTVRLVLALHLGAAGFPRPGQPVDLRARCGAVLDHPDHRLLDDVPVGLRQIDLPQKLRFHHLDLLVLPSTKSADKVWLIGHTRVGDHRREVRHLQGRRQYVALSDAREYRVAGDPAALDTSEPVVGGNEAAAFVRQVEPGLGIEAHVEGGLPQFVLTRSHCEIGKIGVAGFLEGLFECDRAMVAKTGEELAAEPVTARAKNSSVRIEGSRAHRGDSCYDLKRRARGKRSLYGPVDEGVVGAVVERVEVLSADSVSKEGQIVSRRARHAKHFAGGGLDRDDRSPVGPERGDGRGLGFGVESQNDLVARNRRVPLDQAYRPVLLVHEHGVVAVAAGQVLLIDPLEPSFSDQRAKLPALSLGSLHVVGTRRPDIAQNLGKGLGVGIIASRLVF